jgi:transposase
VAREVLPPMARRMRALAAPSEFLAALRSVARREGVRVHEHSGPSSFLCHACGHETAVNDRSVLYYTCGHCLAVHDQDKNAAQVLLAAARASAPAAAEEPLPLAWQKRLAGKQKRRRDAAPSRPQQGRGTGAAAVRGFHPCIAGKMR